MELVVVLRFDALDEHPSSMAVGMSAHSRAGSDSLLVVARRYVDRMNEFWSAVTPAGLAAVATVTVAWLTQRKTAGIHERVASFTAAINDLGTSVDDDDKELVVKLRTMRAEVVADEYRQVIASTGLRRLIFIATITVAIPVFAGISVWFWTMITATDLTSRSNIFDAGWPLAATGLLVLAAFVIGFFVAQHFGEKPPSTNTSANTSTSSS